MTYMKKSNSEPVAVIGAGAAGLMAALSAAETGAAVLLIERNEKVGRKLYITGKGRCNLTNQSTVPELLEHTVRNGKFLYSAFTRFPPSDVMTYFEQLGVPLKTERGGRVFPVSDRAADVVDALYHALPRAGVRLIRDRVLSIRTGDGAVRAVEGETGTYPCRAAILATGGASYPATGSTGDGYAIAAALGHTVLPPRPSLTGLEVAGDECPQMQGLALKNVALTAKNCKGKRLYSGQGELLFTHFGLSGPLILTASAYLRRFETETYTLSIDLKPGLTAEQLDARLLRDFGEAPNRSFARSLDRLLPASLIPVVVARSGIDPRTPVNAVTRGQRQTLVRLLKDLSFVPVGPRPLEEAIVTAGGVKVGEVDPSSMASKRVRGLYFAGEILDVDACTGGFNLQIAWSTGRLAGLTAGRSEEE